MRLLTVGLVARAAGVVVIDSTTPSCALTTSEVGQLHAAKNYAELAAAAPCVLYDTAATAPPAAGSVPTGGTCRPRPHGRRCARPICNLALSGASEHAPEASRVSIAHLRRDPCWHCDRGSSGAGRGQAPTRSRPWTLRAILTDPNGLWWRPRVRRAARLPGRGVEPQATNLRVRK